jgi:fucose permease
LKFEVGERLFRTAASVGIMLSVVLRLGWISVGALLLSIFLMSVSYPTILALGIPHVSYKKVLGVSEKRRTLGI